MESYSDIVQTLLKKRGLKHKKEIDAFLNPSYDNHLHDPFLMLGMDVAVKRILKALEDGEKIAIYSDFDADGIPGAALMHSFLTKIGFSNFRIYIPHRDREGYGFHTHAVEQLAKEGVGLIITVDVGITASDTVTHAKELGVDVIITDHHQPIEGSDCNDAIVVLNPAQKQCQYPFDGLCGAGVAYKLVQALIAHGRQGTPGDSAVMQNIKDLPIGWEKWLLDLVAIATVSDMVPLIDENRALVYWGLKVLRKSPRPGIRALCAKMRINQALLDENDIGFSIGPRINASSRMGESQEAFKLLITESIEEAEILAKRLESLNNKRKGAVANITKQVKKKVQKMQEALGEHELPNVIVTGDPSWNPALVGLAAGSVADTLGKVVCLWGRDGSGVLKGSCRNGGTEYSIVKMFEMAKESLLKFGGHHAAGGFSVSNEHIHSLQDALNNGLNSAEIDDKVIREKQKMMHYDIELALSDVNIKTAQDIAQLAPFGVGNPKPIICLRNVDITSIRHFGKEKNHIEIRIQDTVGHFRKASKFFATAQSFDRELQEGDTVTLLAHLEESSFAGRRTLELRIVNIM